MKDRLYGFHKGMAPGRQGNSIFILERLKRAKMKEAGRILYKIGIFVVWQMHIIAISSSILHFYF